MYIKDCTYEEFKQQSEKINLVIIPVGSLEAHGHHLPLGTDIMLPNFLCESINNKLNDEIWIAPGIPYGQSFDLSMYAGTVNIPSEVLGKYIYHVALSMFNNGLKKIIFLNAHNGNITGLNLATEGLVKLGAEVITINWWSDFSQEILDITHGRGHAGADETSIIMYYNNKIVSPEKMIKNDYKPMVKVNYKDKGKYVYANAQSGDPTLSSKEKGKLLAEMLERNIVDIIKKFKLGEYVKIK